MASEEVVALHLPVLDVLVRQPPDALVVLGEVMVYLPVLPVVWPPHLGVLEELVVPYDYDSRGSSAFAEDLVKALLVELPFADASAMRRVAAMHESVDVAALEKPECVLHVLERKRPSGRHRVVAHAKMRIAHHAKDEVRFLRRLPAGRSRIKATRQRQEP